MKKNWPSTYPLSYSSLQEDAVTEKNSTHIKLSLQKRKNETTDWRAWLRLYCTTFTWRGLQRHWDVFNQCVEIFQLHCQSLNGGTDICPITAARVGTWSWKKYLCVSCCSLVRNLQWPKTTNLNRSIHRQSRKHFSMYLDIGFPFHPTLQGQSCKLTFYPRWRKWWNTRDK